MDKDSLEAPTRLTDHNDAQEPKQSGSNQPTETTQLPSQLNAPVPTHNSQDVTDNGWQQCKNKKKNKKLVIGHSETHTSFADIAKKSVACVTRLKPGTSTDIISDHLNANGINVLSCFDVSRVRENDELKFTCMRVCVYTMDVHMFSNLWPTGVVVRPWKFKTKG